MSKLKIAVLISGGGTNLQALIDACKQPDYPAEIALVISNRTDAYGLKRAEEAHIPTKIINHKDFSSREKFDAQMDKEISSYGVELICLAGFMRLLSDEFVTKWFGKMINIHPSLLPAFKGADANSDAVAYGVKISGCTVHFVSTEMDSGPIILQRTVPVLNDDDRDALAARVLEQEHLAYPEAVRLIAEEKVVIDGYKTIIED